MDGTQKTIIEDLKMLNLPANARILELGMGRGGYTKLIRHAYPDSWIAGYNLFKIWMENKPDWHSPAVDLVSEERYEDITKVMREEDRESFDMVTLGNYRSTLAHMFGLNDETVYRTLLESMAYYLRSGGVFLLVIKTNTCKTPAQECFAERESFKKRYHDPDMNSFQANDGIVDSTLDILKSLDLENITVHEHQDDCPIETGSNWDHSCTALLDEKEEVDQDLRVESERIEQTVKKTGLHRGYFAVISAVK